MGGETTLLFKEEIEVIDTFQNGIFKDIKHINYDGGIQLDVFDLYKSYKENLWLIIEDGNVVFEDALLDCLNYIYRWL